MADDWAVQGETKSETPVVESPPRPVGDRRPPPWTRIVGLVAASIGVASLAATAFVYADMQRDILRLSTDIAQLRLSLDLYAQRDTATAPAATDSAGLTDLSNRLAILEESWRSGAASSAATAPATLPALPGEAGAAAVNAGDGDCLPTGTRFLVAAGDSYPVCGSTGVVDVAAVDNGFISLRDGTVVAAGGTTGLPNSACMIGVVSSGADGMTGYAEIRVTC